MRSLILPKAGLESCNDGIFSTTVSPQETWTATKLLHAIHKVLTNDTYRQHPATFIIKSSYKLKLRDTKMECLDNKY